MRRLPNNSTLCIVAMSSIVQIVLICCSAFVYQHAIWATKGTPCMLLLLQVAPLSVGLALAGRSWCLCLEQEDVWFQGVCLSRPEADKEICCGPPGPACRQPLVYPNFCVSKKLSLFVLFCLPGCLPVCLTVCLIVFVLMPHCNAQLCVSGKVMALRCTSVIHGSTS